MVRENPIQEIRYWLFGIMLLLLLGFGAFVKEFVAAAIAAGVLIITTLVFDHQCKRVSSHWEFTIIILGGILFATTGNFWLFSISAITFCLSFLIFLKIDYDFYMLFLHNLTSAFLAILLTIPAVYLLDAVLFWFYSVFGYAYFIVHLLFASVLLFIIMFFFIFFRYVTSHLFGVTIPDLFSRQYPSLTWMERFYCTHAFCTASKRAFLWYFPLILAIVLLLSFALTINKVEFENNVLDNTISQRNSLFFSSLNIIGTKISQPDDMKKVAVREAPIDSEEIIDAKEITVCRLNPISCDKVTVSYDIKSLADRLGLSKRSLVIESGERRIIAFFDRDYSMDAIIDAGIDTISEAYSGIPISTVIEEYTKSSLQREHAKRSFWVEFYNTITGQIFDINDVIKYNNRQVKTVIAKRAIDVLYDEVGYFEATKNGFYDGTLTAEEHINLLKLKSEKSNNGLFELEPSQLEEIMFKGLFYPWHILNVEHAAEPDNMIKSVQVDFINRIKNAPQGSPVNEAVRYELLSKFRIICKDEGCLKNWIEAGFSCNALGLSDDCINLETRAMSKRGFARSIKDVKTLLNVNNTVVEPMQPIVVIGIKNIYDKSILFGLEAKCDKPISLMPDKEFILEGNGATAVPLRFEGERGSYNCMIEVTSDGQVYSSERLLLSIN